MANFDLFFNELLKHEGGWSDHPDDPGGATNKGITLATWTIYGSDLDGDGDIDVDDLKRLSNAQAAQIYKKQYWDKLKADQFKNQQVAEIVFDHGVNAGISRAAKMLQMILNVKFDKDLAVDGAIGPKTIAALNSVDQAQLYNDFKQMRIKYYYYRANILDKVEIELREFFNKILKISPSNLAKSFINGWLNRVNSFKDMAVSAIKDNQVFIISIGIAVGAAILYKKKQKEKKEQA